MLSFLPSNTCTYFIIIYMVCCGARPYAQSDDMKTEDTAIHEMISKIDREVDPAFVYSYAKSKYVPPQGQTLLIMGQTVERITEYIDHFPDQPLPAGWSAYWGVPSFEGILDAHKNETGSTQHHQMLVDAAPNTVVHSAMWMVGTWDVAKKAGKGHYDEVIKQYAQWAASIDRPIYLRIGYEFDGIHNALPPKQYVKAYRRIVDLLRKEGADKIAYVWHSYAAAPYHDHPLSAWYPGDDYVDWVGISVFGHAYGGADFGPYCDTVMHFARAHQKPVMIAEASPIRGIDRHDTQVWDDWFVPFFSFVHRKNIKAVCFINEDWPSLFIDGISAWKDARLSNHDMIAKAWFYETNQARYLKQSDALFDLLGYEK